MTATPEASKQSVGLLAKSIVVGAVFLALWSTGYASARLGLPYVEPFTFLMIRYGLAAAIIIPFTVVTNVIWPSWPHIGWAALVGLLINGVFLGGIFFAISQGFPASYTALIAGMQPIVTATFAAVFLRERLGPIKWLGQAFGLVGIALVLGPKLSFEPSSLAALVACFIGLAAMCIGTVLHKRYCTTIPLAANSTIQFTSAAIGTGLVAVLFESMTIVWAPNFLIALVTLVFVSSLGATTLLYYLIRKNAASGVSSLFYLVPGVAAVLEFILFDQTMNHQQIAGMVIASAGVALISRRINKPQSK